MGAWRKLKHGGLSYVPAFHPPVEVPLHIGDQVALRDGLVAAVGKAVENQLFPLSVSLLRKLKNGAAAGAAAPRPPPLAVTP